MPSATEPTPELLARFHEELRLRNQSVLLWSTAIFGLLYTGWTIFDWLLEPALWGSFLAIRLSVATFGVAVALVCRSPGLQRWTWEAFWVWLFACGAGIAGMLPHVGDSVLQYILGYSLILYGAGLLPFWRPRWAVTNIVAIVVMAPLAFLVWPSVSDTGDLVSGLFFVLTGAAASVVMAAFKYSLARRDFLTRVELATATERLGQALSRLEASDRLKNRFFANVSHELRTPLTLILAPVQAMQATEGDARRRRDLATVEQNAERLLRLIDDLLDLSRLDAGGLRLRLASVDLGALVHSNVERCLPAAEHKGLRLEVQVQGAPPAVLGDPHRLEIVITNLVGNALKYTPTGGCIQVRVRQVDQAVRVEVQDDGPGIPKDEVTQVFERFFQAEGSREIGAGGVGIGLSLARELVQLHGGAMDLDTEEGRGSTFSFQIPLGRDHIRPEAVERRGGVAERRVGQREGQSPGRRATDAPPPTSVEVEAGPPTDPGLLPDERPVRLERGRRPRILVAEDEESLGRFVADLLAPDCDVLQATDGEEAWRMVRAERPDLVLSDVMMPERSGLSLCRAIKTEPTVAGTPVILLTARAGFDDTLQAYAHGADDFVAKPFHPRILVARINAQLKLRALSAQLAQREKLAAVGGLAAGILHEVRNPLNALLSATRTLTTGKVGEAGQQRLLAVMQDAGERIHALTWTLDAHARPAEQGGPELCNLVAGLESTLRLLQHRLGQVEVLRDFQGETLARVQAAPINQVFVNLVDNAVKAGAQHLWLRVDATGPRPRVVVEDDGRGIPPELLPRIFDAFVTTAGPGEGTGLGLYLSRDLVERMGGSLVAEHREGGGARFTLELPGEADTSPR